MTGFTATTTTPHNTTTTARCNCHLYTHYQLVERKEKRTVKHVVGRSKKGWWVEVGRRGGWVGWVGSVEGQQTSSAAVGVHDLVQIGVGQQWVLHVKVQIGEEG
ncbi:hypothetical protein ACH5RR_035343 [Cinchona calisaya]|uniref:Uncharacterized protein n=1 Tax=Cinchona calisaya TaxID=153742 RepID=A0ABD2YHZ8_9GENT